MRRREMIGTARIYPLVEKSHSVSKCVCSYVPLGATIWEENQEISFLLFIS